MSDTPPDYCAFVSYRHAEPDRAWARWVVETLERWRTPRWLVRERGLPRRLGRAFLDEQELSAGPGLQAEIERRLERSRFLIVVCSPAARGRPWIEEEVRAFLRWGRGAHILPLLVEGNPSEALPEALLARGARADGREPIAADVREVAGEGLRERRRRAALQLLAPILGVDLDTLRRRDDQRRHRRWASLTLGLGLGVIVLATLAVWALTSNARARDRLVALHTEQGREALVSGAPSKALPHLREAYRLGGRAPALRFLLARALQGGERLKTVLRCRGAPMFEAIFSPDGQQVATACDDGCVRLWRTEDGTQIHELVEKGPACRGLAFSPDGRSLVASAADLTLRVFRTADGALERVLQAPEAAHVSPAAAAYLFRALFVPGTRRCVVVGAHRTRLLADLDAGTLISLPESSGPVLHFEGERPEDYEWANAVSPDATRVATGDQHGRLRLYDAQSLTVGVTRSAHPNNKVSALEFSPSGEHLYSAGADGTLACWLPQAQEPTWRTVASRASGGISCLAVAAGGSLLTGSQNGFVQLWRPEDGHLVHGLALHSTEVTSVALDSKGERLLSASLDGTALVSSVRTGRVLSVLGGHTRGVNVASFSPAGDLALTASSDGTACLWPLAGDTGQGRLVVLHAGAPGVRLCTGGAGGFALLATREGQIHRISAGGELLGSWQTAERIAISHAVADNEHAICVDAHGDVYRITLARPELSPALVGEAHTGTRTLALLSGGRFATADNDGYLNIYSRVGAGTPERFKAPDALNALAASADGLRLLCGANNGSVSLWQDGQPGLKSLHQAHRQHVMRVALSRDARLALSAGWDGMAVLWNVESGRAVEPLRGHEGSVFDCAFDRSGEHAATGGQDGSVCLWSTATGRLEHKFSGSDSHRAAARVAFSPDGHLLVSYGSDGTLRVWDTGSGRLLQVLEGHVHPVAEAIFYGDGASLLSADAEGELRWWDLAYETRTPDEVEACLDARPPCPWALDDDGQLVPRR